MTASAFLSRFTGSVPLALALCTPAAVLTAVVLRRTPRSVAGLQLPWLVLLLDALLAIGLMTLLPAHNGSTATNLHLGWDVDRLELAANFALYVPAGFCLARAFTTSRLRLLAGLALVLAVPTSVEALQHFLALGRITDINDVAANAAGALTGIGVSLLLATGPQDVRARAATR